MSHPEQMLRVKFRAFAAIGAAILISSPERAQVQTQPPEFEVATVKVNKDGHAGSLVRTPGGLTATNAEFSRLIEMAFQTRSLDLSAVPEALRMERFDIVAKANRRIAGDRYWEMLRTLIEERFALRHHMEEKNSPWYALLSSKRRTALGPEIMPSPDPDCPVNAAAGNFCGVSAQPGRMIGQRVTMARIALELSAFTDRPVRDQTGLTGSFDFQLTWTPDEYTSPDGPVKLLNGAALDVSGSSLYSAVTDQLGLKLQPKTGQIQVLVIDHAERPQEN